MNGTFPLRCHQPAHENTETAKTKAEVRSQPIDAVAVGTDYDGMIVPPPELRDGSHYPILVQHMLDRNWSPDRIKKVLGANFLRVLRVVRPR